jgi:hypothetical protein
MSEQTQVEVAAPPPREFELTVPQARYLLTRLYRPFLMAGTPATGDDGNMLFYLEEHIKYTTCKARFKETEQFIRTPNLAGFYTNGQQNNVYQELQSTIQRYERVYPAYKDLINTFLTSTGYAWLEEARAQGVNL